MLPYFKIIEAEPNSMQDGHPAKPKRNKRFEVPVHRHEEPRETHKTFSANVSSRRKHDCRHRSPSKVQISDHGDNVDNIESTNRISKRVILKENERLIIENQEYLNVQDHLTKKNCKLKEKLQQLTLNLQEATRENDAIKVQYNDLAKQYTDCRNELERPKICQNCLELSDHLDKSKREYMNLRKFNQEMNEDCNMLKNVVYRLNVQLERYQQKLHANRIPLRDLAKPERKDGDSAATVNAENLNIGDSHFNHSHSPVSWGKVNAHTLAPLLDAYQEAMHEKEDIIENYEMELTKFTSKLKEILKENENLHSRLTEDDECSKVLKSQLELLKGELKSVKDQNDLLIKKCALKQDKIEEILKCYEQKVEQLKRDYNVVHEQYTKSRNEVVALKEKNKSLVDVQDDFRNERQQYIPVSVHTASVNECKKWYEELKLQYENEKSKLTENVEILKQQISDLNAKLTGAGAEKVELENRIKTAEKFVKKAEAKYLDVEHRLHEVQLSRSTCRKQLHKAMNFAKDLVNEQETLLRALNQRQQENKAVKRIGTDIASRMDILRNELKTVQKEAWQELSTVEERLQEQDTIIASLKEEHEQEIDRLKQIIDEKEKCIGIRAYNASASKERYVHK